MYPTRIPRILRRLMPGFRWSVDTRRNELYLTFDDGPIPEVTPWVLDQLAAYGAKGTFFCIGRNCGSNPDILDRIRREGHTVGNHTWDHPRGRGTSTFSYLRNVLRCQALTGSPLFRPPYGSITKRQSSALRRRFDVVMWDVLSADFDTRMSGERCLRNVIDHARPGSIVVFHDSLKAEARLRYALPRTLAHFSAKGYCFKAL
ncbi:MAG: polysaccharide deacetylase family protein [Flavobacteriales bacterium]|nr:polysaccharide deacetylase family protein [Flavobacteriales bacterium]